MNVNANMASGFLLVFLIFMLLISILSYYLGKRKTNTPMLATFIGMFLAFIPPLALIYLIVLVVKSDIKTVGCEN